MPAEPEKSAVPEWYVYILRTAAGVLYTGISTDPDRRLGEHEGTRRGARSLRGKGPLQIVYRLRTDSRSSASQLEARIKKMSRARKLQLISGNLGGFDRPA